MAKGKRKKGKCEAGEYVNSLVELHKLQVALLNKLKETVQEESPQGFGLGE